MTIRCRRVTPELIRKHLCPKFGLGLPCKYHFPFKDISRPGTPEYARGVWVLKARCKGECVLADICFDIYLNSSEESDAVTS